MLPRHRHCGFSLQREHIRGSKENSGWAIYKACMAWFSNASLSRGTIRISHGVQLLKTFFRSEYLNYHGFICLVTGLSHEKHLSCPHPRELQSSFPDIFKLWQLERNSMNSCIFVNKDTPKFKGAREVLHVINCTPRGFFSREALAQETVQFKMSQWRMVPTVAEKQARHFAFSGSS